MITDPVQRTRKLYALEREMAHWLGYERITLAEGNLMLDQIWSKYNPRWKRPELKFKGNDGYSYFWQGRIVLRQKEQDNVTLLHEAVHAMGYGSSRNHHSAGFMRHYLLLLHDHLPWRISALSDQAKKRGLI